MAATTGTIGGTANAPFTGAWAAGEDFSSAWQVDTAIAADGRWDTGTGTWSVQKPFKVYSHYVNFRSGGSGTVSQRLATNAALSTGGTYQLKDSGTIDPDTDLTPAWNPGFLGLADVYYYGGFRMVSGASVLFYREGVSDADMTTNNLIYQDGTSVSTWSGTSMYQTFSWYTVPNAPTSVTVTATSGTTVSLSWVAPTDNGGTALTGYRLLYKTSGQSWSQASSTGKFGTSTTTTYQLSGLKNGTTYNFYLAATNAVTDDHNTKDGLAYSSVSAWVGQKSAQVDATTSGGVYNGTAWVPQVVQACSYAPTVLTSTAWSAPAPFSGPITITVPSGHTVAVGDTVYMTNLTSWPSVTTSATVTAVGATTVSLNAATNSSSSSGTFSGTITSWRPAASSAYVTGSGWLTFG